MIDYFIYGASLIEFNLNSNGEVKNISIVESLGIPFDKSITIGLGHYLHKKIIFARSNFNNQYRLETILKIRF